MFRYLFVLIVNPFLFAACTQNQASSDMAAFGLFSTQSRGSQTTPAKAKATAVNFFPTATSCADLNQKLLSPTGKVQIGHRVMALGKNIGSIFQDKNKNYWFASNGEGVFFYDGKMLFQITEKDGLCSNFVTKIEADANEHLWFSTREGVCKFDGTTISNQNQNVTNASSYGLWNFYKDGLFLGHKKGICYYDGKGFTNFVIHPKSFKHSETSPVSPYDIYATLVDRVGNVWFGTQSEGVCRYDGKSFVYLKDKNLAGPAVRTMFQDKAGKLWFGNNGGGLFCYDGQTLRNITQEKGLENLDFLKGKFNDKLGSLARVWAINEDKDGNLWVGTIDAGLWKFDGTTLTNYTTKDGLTGNAIWTIFKDAKGDLWFVTNGDTVCKFNGKTFEKFEFMGC